MRGNHQTILLAVLTITGLTTCLSAHAQTTFDATYNGIATITGPDANGFLHVTSTLADPGATFGLTEARFNQTVFVFANPYVIVGSSTFQPTGGAGSDKLFTSYSGISTPFDPPNGVVVSNISGQFAFTGGTGAFAGAGGTGTWAGQANIVTGAVTVNFHGTVTPEPGAFALVSGLGVSALATGLRRRRR